MKDRFAPHLTVEYIHFSAIDRTCCDSMTIILEHYFAVLYEWKNYVVDMISMTLKKGKGKFTHCQLEGYWV